MSKFIRRAALAILVCLPIVMAHAGAGGYVGVKYLGDKVIIDWDSFTAAGAAGATTGLATGDISVYKQCGASAFNLTKRASSSGYALVDTDGQDIDAHTGWNAISLDTADNTTAGFWQSGCDYFVNLDSITIDSQTVRLTARFSLDPSVLSFGTLSADSADTASAKVGTTGITATNQYVARVIWNVTTNEKQCITSTTNGSPDVINFAPNVPTIWHTSDVYRIMLGDTPCYPLRQQNLDANGNAIIGAFVDATHPVDSDMADSWRNQYKNGGAVSTITNNNISSYLSTIQGYTSVIGTPVDLGTGATIVANIHDSNGMLAFGTCTSGSTTTCANAVLTQGNNFWNGWQMITFPGTPLPARCIRGFNASTDTLSWPEALPSTASGQKFVLLSAPECRNAP